MPTIRQIHNIFKDLIERQKKVIDALKAEDRVVKRDLEAADRALGAAIDGFLPALDRGRLENLTTAAQKAGAPYDFVRIVEGALVLNRDVAAQRADLEKHYGAPARMESQVKTLRAACEATEQALAARTQTIGQLDRRMSVIDEHNAAWGRQITPASAASFTTYSFFSWLGDSEYRSGRNALLAYKAAGHDFAADHDAREQAKTGQTSLRATLAEQRQPLQEWEGALARSRQLEAAFMGPERIHEAVKATLHEALTTHDGFGHAFAVAFPGDGTAGAVSLALIKLANLDKVAIGLESSIAQNEGTLGNLQKPMSKLAKGVRHRPSKTVSMDLDNIVKGVTGQQAVAAYKTVSAEKARAGIQNFQPPITASRAASPSASSSDNSLFFLQGMMVMWLLTDSGVDGAYAQSTLNVDAAAAAEMNVDMQALEGAPDISGTLNDAAAAGALEGLDAQSLQDFSSFDAAAFDHAGLDAAGLDGGAAGGLDGGIPSIDTGSFTVDIGSIDTGSFNDYSSGGFDGGGGGGGFD